MSYESTVEAVRRLPLLNRSKLGAHGYTSQPLRDEQGTNPPCGQMMVSHAHHIHGEIPKLLRAGGNGFLSGPPHDFSLLFSLRYLRIDQKSGSKELDMILRVCICWYTRI